MRRAIGVPHRLVLLVCAVLAGWSLWTAGILDGPAAKALRGSSVYVGDTWEVDEAAAEAIIGNRRLTVAFIDEARPSDTCDDLARAADGTLIAIVYRDRDDPEDVDIYGCSRIPGLTSDENIGRAAVVETIISAGAEQLAADPTDMLKVVAANFDTLVRLDYLPGNAREIEVSAPRYLLAFIALFAVLSGTVLAWWLGRRAATVVADSREEEVAVDDRRAELDAELAGIAGRILELSSLTRHREVVGQAAVDYSLLVRELEAGPAADPAVMMKARQRIVSLRKRLRRLR